MHPEKYSVKWHAYSDHLKSMMKELMMNEDFSDITLVTEDKKQIKANINILSVCSPVFKDILSKDKNSSPIMYLRGIQYSEIESIIQFIYLGEATLYEERMDEFLAVAKSLQIKKLCKAETESNDELEDYPSPNNQDTSSELVEKKTVTYDKIEKQAPQEIEGHVVVGKYECDQCNKIYPNRQNLIRHKESVHLGVKYPCAQCDLQFTQQVHLRTHIQSKHEGVKYDCDQCDLQFTHPGSLFTHIKSWHEGVTYACDHCDYQATTQGSLTKHKSRHEGIKYICTQCDYKATTQSNLTKHITSKHEHSL